MKTLLLSLSILGTVFLLSAALPEDKSKDHYGILDPDPSHENVKSVQRRRPPMKIPGPKLKKDEEKPEKPTGNDSQMETLADENKGKKKGKKDLNLTKDQKNSKDFVSLDEDSKRGEKGKKGKGKDKDLVKKDEDDADNQETQEESSSDVSGSKPQAQV